jgi:cold shock CspA family protein
MSAAAPILFISLFAFIFDFQRALSDVCCALNGALCHCLAARYFSFASPLSHLGANTMEQQERLRGIIHTWRPEKRFGFVRSPSCDTDFFLHDTDLALKNRTRILVGNLVEFSPAQSERGFQAFDAIIVVEAQQTNSAPKENG